MRRPALLLVFPVVAACAEPDNCATAIECDPVGVHRVELTAIAEPDDCGFAVGATTALDVIVDDDLTVRHPIPAAILRGTVYSVGDGFAVDVWAPGGTATCAELLHVQFADGARASLTRSCSGATVCEQSFDVEVLP